MERVREHFCWIKVVVAEGADKAAPAVARGLAIGGGGAAAMAMAMPMDWTQALGRGHGVLDPWGPVEHGGVDPRTGGGHSGSGGGHGGGHRLAVGIEALPFGLKNLDQGGVDPRHVHGQSGGQGGGQGGQGGGQDRAAFDAQLSDAASSEAPGSEGEGGDQGGVDPRTGGQSGGGGNGGGRGGEEVDQGGVDPRPTRGALTFAGTTFMGAWRAEPVASASFGDPSLRIFHRPVRGSIDDALRWQSSPEGQAWLSGALAHSLISFVAIGDF